MAQDKWQRPHRNRNYLTLEQRAYIREGFLNKEKAETVAKRLNCPVRAVQACYARFELQQTGSSRPAPTSRHYKSNFEPE